MWFVIGLLVGVVITTILNVFIDDLLEENHDGEQTIFYVGHVFQKGM